MLRRVLLFAIPAILLSAGSAATDTAPGVMETLVIETLVNSFTLTVEIASEPESRERGLMFRHNLPEGRGMLFDYETPRRVSMWMKNTYISLDMLFIRMTAPSPPSPRIRCPSRSTSISRPGAGRGVLEFAAGTVKRLGLRPNDKVYSPYFQDN